MSAINIPATMLDGRGERDTSGERRIEMVGALVAARSVVIFLFPVLVRKEGRKNAQYATTKDRIKPLRA